MTDEETADLGVLKILYSVILVCGKLYYYIIYFTFYVKWLQMYIVLSTTV
jgi:hypothetical protein